jgi:glycerate-2-kinase
VTASSRALLEDLFRAAVAAAHPASCLQALLPALGRTPPVNLKQAAARLGVHYQTAYRWVRSGDLARG